MFDSITASIAYLRSKAIEWYAWFQQGDAPPASEEPIAPADTPVVPKPSDTRSQLSIPPAPTPQRLRAATTAKKVTPIVPAQKTAGATLHKRDDVRKLPTIAQTTFSARGRNLEYLIGQTREEVRRRFFTGQIVGFTGLMQFGTLPGYYHGDQRIRDHGGLHCVADFGFAWPATDVADHSDAANAEKAGVWPTSHEMVSVYKYRVDARTGLTLAERQERLRRAVVGLGLRCVAEHIAANIQLAKNRRNANMERAIDKWEDDLDWLHDRFYKNSIHSFVWPKVYRNRRKAS